MSASGNVRATERTLKRCARRATADGLIMIYDAWSGINQHGRNGVCVLAAYNEFAAGERLSLPDDSHEMCEAWDSIESGFDGTPHRKAKTLTGHRVVKRWWTLGYRLRRALRPSKVVS